MRLSEARMSETKPATEQSAARRRLTITLKQLARRVDHEEVVEHVREEGHLSGRYLFMTVMSCAISILGLLLSSPAVIIGAMLTPEEQGWIEAYHNRVYEMLSPLLEDDTRKWLEQATRPV